MACEQCSAFGFWRHLTIEICVAEHDTILALPAASAPGKQALESVARCVGFQVASQARFVVCGDTIPPQDATT